MAPGDAVAFRLRGPRRCIGIWLPETGQRRLCPHNATIPVGASAQCPTCSGADPGRALARDATPTDPRSFALYLTWFGPGLLKIGLTASERGTDRLAEQGAIAFTWCGYGPLMTVRRAERTASATAAVRERIARRAKLAAWWQLGDPAQRREALTAAHQYLSTTAAWPPELRPGPVEVHDLTAVFGLTGPPPRPSHEITAVADAATVAGTVTCLAGRDAIIATAAGHLLIDLRLLAGWIICPTDQPTHGVTLTPTTLGSSDENRQDALF